MIKCKIKIERKIASSGCEITLILDKTIQELQQSNRNQPPIRNPSLSWVHILKKP
jgi:hypothetical protein